MSRATVQPGMPRRTFKMAVEFYQAGQRLSVPNIGPPVVVCFALSIELYLKVLIMIARQHWARGHDLLKLYDELDVSVKATCAVHYAYPNREDLLRADISSISTSFDEWRYQHEKEFPKGRSVEVLRRVGDCLHKAAIAIYVPPDTTRERLKRLDSDVGG